MLKSFSITKITKKMPFFQKHKHFKKAFKSPKTKGRGPKETTSPQDQRLSWGLLLSPSSPPWSSTHCNPLFSKWPSLNHEEELNTLTAYTYVAAKWAPEIFSPHQTFPFLCHTSHTPSYLCHRGQEHLVTLIRIKAYETEIETLRVTDYVVWHYLH